jgi:hypothetical protein
MVGNIGLLCNETPGSPGDSLSGHPRFFGTLFLCRGRQSSTRRGSGTNDCCFHVFERHISRLDILPAKTIEYGSHQVIFRNCLTSASPNGETDLFVHDNSLKVVPMHFRRCGDDRRSRKSGDIVKEGG